MFQLKIRVVPRSKQSQSRYRKQLINKMYKILHFTLLNNKTPIISNSILKCLFYYTLFCNSISRFIFYIQIYYNNKET